MGSARARSVLLVALVGAVAAFAVALLTGPSSQADDGGASPGAARALLSPATGSDVEIPALRTADSQTFRRTDGSFRSVISSVPVNFRDGSGVWQPIDTRLRSDGAGGLQTTAAATEVSLPSGLDDPAKVSSGAGWVSFALRGAEAVAPQASGATATYADVLDGVDAAYTAQASGVKETLTLADSSAPSTYRFALAASSGLVAASGDDGSVVFADHGGVVRFVLPAPTVQAAGQADASTQHVAYHLSEDGQSLSVVVDPAWLAGASFPVKVDPTIWDGASVTACTLASGSLAASSDCGSGLVKIGYDGSHVLRAALRFDGLADDHIPAGAAIDYAQLGLTSEGMDHVEVHPQIDVAGLGHTLGAGATWNRYDATHTWTAPGGDTSATPDVRPLVWGTFFGGDVGEPWGWDVSGLVQSWLRDPSTNHGLLLQAHDETATNVMSVDSPTGTNQGPYLQIDWRWRPGIERDQTYQTVAVDEQSALNVNVVSGNLSVQSSDVHLPGVAGMDLDLSRTYNSGDLADDHLTGSAWSPEVNGAGLDLETHFLSNGHTLYANGGAIYRFDRDPSADTATTWGFITPSGIDATMTQDSATAVVTVTFADGTVWTYTDGGFYGQQLTQISDSDGHHIDLSYDGDDGRALQSITDTHGDVLTVTRDEDGNVTGLTDATDRHWAYAKNTDVHYRLDSVTDPDAHTTNYHYRTDIPTIWDLLDKITDPDGHTIKLQYSADGNPFHLTKITRAVDATTAHDLIWQFDYSPATGVGDACTTTGTVGRTVETDPDDQQITYCYDTNGQVIQTFGDPTTTAPTNTTPPAITGTTTDGHTLSADTGTWTGTAPITYTRQWQRCNTIGNDCTNITDQTDSSYTLTPDDIGSTIKAVITATNTAGSASQTSVATATIAATAPANTTPPSITGTATDGHALTADDGTWTGTAPITYTRQWQRCDSSGEDCHDITDATGTTYELTADDVGSSIRVTVTATNAADTITATSPRTAVAVGGPLTNTTRPTISGTTTDGHTLSATDGTWTGAAPLTYTRQWRRCDSSGAACEDIADETEANHALTAADIGSTIRVVVTATDTAGSASATSDQSAVIATAPPTNTAFPLISGTTTDGHTLSATDGTWTGTTPITYTHQWRRCDTVGANCTDISGATSSTYVLTASDVGATIKAVVTAGNSGGQASASTPASAAVAAATPASTDAPLISGTTRDGETLTAGRGSWSGTMPLSYSYQWRSCDASGGGCSDVAGGTSNAYTLDTANVGQTLRVVVTATNAAGSATATSAATAEIQTAPPVLVVAPTVTGIAQVGQTLATTVGTWTGHGTVFYAVQWQTCDAAGAGCHVIPGATGNSYVLSADEVGETVRSRISATDDRGTAAASSTPTAAVEALTPADVECTDSWTGTQADHDWQTAANWSTGVVPASDDIVCAGAGADVRVTHGANVAAQILDEGSLTISGGTLSVTPLAAEGPSAVSDFAVSSGALTGSATVGVVDELHWTGGQLNGDGETVIAAGASAVVSYCSGCQLIDDTRSFVNHGTLQLASGVLKLNNGATLINDASFRIGTDAVATVGLTGDGYVANSGSLSADSGAGSVVVRTAIDNEGVVRAASGTTLALAAGGLVGVVEHGSWSSSGSGLVSFQSGTFLLADGDLVGAVEVNGARVETTGSVQQSGTLALKGGSIAGAGSLEIGGTLNWTGGQLNGDGETVIAAGASAVVSYCSGCQLTDDARSLVNHGTLQLASGVLKLNNGATLTNAGTLRIGSDAADTTGVVGDGKVINTGTLTADSGWGSVAVRTTLENDGEVQAGGVTELGLFGGTPGAGLGLPGLPSGANDGRWLSEEGSAIAFDAGVYQLEEGTTFVGSVKVGGGRVTAPSIHASGVTLALSFGSLTLTDAGATTSLADLVFTGGSLVGPGRVNISDGLQWVGGVIGGRGVTTLGVGSTSTLDATGSYPASIDASALVNAGQLTLVHGLLHGGDSALLENLGTIFADADDTSVIGGFWNDGEGPLIENLGTIEKVAGTGVTRVDWAVTNAGKIFATTGELQLNGPVMEIGPVGGSGGGDGDGGGQQRGPGNSASPNFPRSCAGDPVDCASGNQFEVQTDISVPGRGLGLALTRTYNSQAAASATAPGAFGYGWTASYSDHLVLNPANGLATVMQADGSSTPFIVAPGGGFHAPPWISASLVQESDGTFRYTLPDGKVFLFDADGRLTAEADRADNQTTMTYDAGGRLSQITDPSGRSLTLAYNTGGTVASVTDPDGRVTDYTYAGGELTAVGMGGVSGDRWEFGYDTTHQLTSLTDANGHTTTSTYDAQHRVTTQTDAKNRTRTWDYGTDATTITNPGGDITRELFSNGEPTQITRAYGTAKASTQTITYDASLAPVTVTDADDRTTTYTYDNEGNRTSVTWPRSRFPPQF